MRRGVMRSRSSLVTQGKDGLGERTGETVSSGYTKCSVMILCVKHIEKGRAGGEPGRDSSHKVRMTRLPL